MKRINTTKLDASAHPRERGRPREFNVDTALDRAILYFREHGYHAASIASLSQALQLSAGSLYKAFHSKRQLFKAAFERYLIIRRHQLTDMSNDAESGRDKLFRVLKFYAESSCADEGRKGCLVIVGAVELASTDAEMAREVAAIMKHHEQQLTRIICAGQQDGSINIAVEPGVTARLMLALVQGLRVLGKAGRTREEMIAVVQTAMKLLD
ncbi:TetR/AcrR family transcriptional regulator [Erwinia endophytica]|uniref:TetR/AcrR family transcriptional regulator n=1 Tax=Erwinia endophytica TaxID=1563158 RepID=UPI00186B6EAD|nr:TetR/AcrR family transcriptional regulator [Erwinia endophytica]